MIIGALLDFVHALISTVIGWIEALIPPAPAFIQEIGPAVTEVFQLIPGPVLHFVPIVPVLAMGVTVLGLVVLFGSIRFTRRVLSIFTGGGGNA